MGKANEIINFFKGIKNFAKKSNGLTYTLKHILELYNQKKIDEETFSRLFRDVYASGLNVRGDTSFILDQKGVEGGIAVAINLLPHLEGLVGAAPEIKVSGKALKQRVLTFTRQNNKVESKMPYTYGVINMEGIYAKIIGGISIQVSAGYTKSAASALDTLELGTAAIGVAAGVSINGEGYFLAVSADNAAYFSTVTDNVMQASQAIMHVLKKPIQNALPKKSDTQSLHLWSTSGLAKAEATAGVGIDFTSLIEGSLGANGAAEVEASLSHKKYRLITTDSENVSRIQDTEMTMKKAGALIELSVGDVNFLSSGITSSKDPIAAKGKNFVFINSLSYEGSIASVKKGTGQLIQKESTYVMGQSLSVQAWKRYFQEEYLQHKDTPEKSPYIAMLSKKLQVSAQVISLFLMESAGVLNDILQSAEGEELSPTAFFVEAQFSPATRTINIMDAADITRKAIKGTLSDNRLVSLNLRYPITSSLKNSTALSFGFGVGKTHFNIGFGLFEDSGSLEVANVYTSHKDVYAYNPFTLLITL